MSAPENELSPDELFELDRRQFEEYIRELATRDIPTEDGGRIEVRIVEREFPKDPFEL